MKILLENIKEDGLRWEGEVELDNSRLLNEACCTEPARVKVEIYPINNYYRLTGEMKGSVQLQCSRCLDTFNKDYQLKFEDLIVKEPLSGELLDKELMDNDMNFSFNHGEEIDLKDVITEQLLLDLPMKLLCSPDCRGLCTFCGENLNHNICDCHLKTENVDPRFTELLKLKKQTKF